MMEKLRSYLPPVVQLVAQGDIVANSLVKYLKNHPEMDSRCSKQGTLTFYTTDDPRDFDRHATYFYGEGIKSERVFL